MDLFAKKGRYFPMYSTRVNRIFLSFDPDNEHSAEKMETVNCSCKGSDSCFPDSKLSTLIHKRTIFEQNRFDSESKLLEASIWIQLLGWRCKVEEVRRSIPERPSSDLAARREAKLPSNSVSDVCDFLPNKSFFRWFWPFFFFPRARRRR